MRCVYNYDDNDLRLYNIIMYTVGISKTRRQSVLQCLCEWGNSFKEITVGRLSCFIWLQCVVFIDVCNIVSGEGFTDYNVFNVSHLIMAIRILKIHAVVLGSLQCQNHINLSRVMFTCRS